MRCSFVTWKRGRGDHEREGSTLRKMKQICYHLSVLSEVSQVPLSPSIGKMRKNILVSTVATTFPDLHLEQ